MISAISDEMASTSHGCYLHRFLSLWDLTFPAGLRRSRADRFATPTRGNCSGMSERPG